MKVKRNAFLLIACLLWNAAGFNILRASCLAPDRFIAVFYTGLGASLLLAGLLFGMNFGKAATAARRR